MEKDIVECNCIVERLLVQRFQSLSREEKENIIISEVPQPDINLTQENENQATQKRFLMHIYTNFNWLCGCPRLKKLFCWPCLLFSNSTTKWTALGFDDLTYISNCINYHNSSSVHKHALEKLQNLQALIKNPAQFDNSVKRANITKYMSTCNCVIEKILRTNFQKMSHKDKVEIINGEIPKPNLRMAQQSENELEQFHMVWYTFASWLCGCEYLLKLYCWPCLLFSPTHTLWSFYGCKKLTNIHKSIKTHQSSKEHISAEEALIKFKRSHLEASLVPEVESNTCNCIIETLVNKTFRSMQLSRKKAIVDGGIPQPNFNIICNKNTPVKKKSVEKLYSNTPWLCGCAHLSKLFCWPCLLFCDTLNSWSKFGFTNVESFDESRKKHQKTPHHIKSKTKLQFLQRDLKKSNSIVPLGSSVLNIDSVTQESEQQQEIHCEITNNDFENKNEEEVVLETNEAVELWEETDSIIIKQEEENSDYSGIQSNFNNESYFSESEMFGQYDIKQELLNDDVDIEMEFAKFVEKKVEVNSEMMDVASLPSDTFSSSTIIDQASEISTFTDRCLVESVINLKFESMSLAQKKLIIYSEIHKPDLLKIFPECMDKSNEVLNLYIENNWMCGCEHLMKVYCWPCLLFSTSTDEWNNFVFGDLERFKHVVEVHETSEEHIRAQDEFKSFITKHQISIANKLIDTERNLQPENFTKLTNREALSKPMDFECFEPQIKLENSIDERPKNVEVLLKNSPVIKIVLERTDLKKHLVAQSQIPSKIQEVPVLKERPNISDKEHVENLTIAKILKRYNEKKHQKQSPAYSCDCVIETLTKNGNTKLLEDDIRALVNADVPRPYLDIIQKHNTGTYVRHFRYHYYSDAKWLCGCKREQKLFCWPCLIFSRVRNCWNTSGHHNLGNLKKACLRHELTKSHLGAQILFKRYQDRIANVDIEKTPNSCNEEDNKIISGNRYIISKMIDAICFLSNRGQIKVNLIDLLLFMSESDGKLKHFLDSSIMNKSFLNSIQDNLTNAIATVVLEEIKQEIRESTFVSIVVAESKRYRSYLSLHMRYLNKNNHIQERLVGLKNEDSSTTLLKYIEEKVIDLDCGGKIIAQAHDGISLTDEIHKSVQTTFPFATLTHHHSFKLNFLLSQAIRGLDGFDHFFQKIKMISSFFCKSTKRSLVLNTEIRKRIPDFDQINLQYNNKILSVINIYKSDMLKVLEDILTNGEEWDADTTLYALGLQRLLKDLQFNFNMKLFANIYNGTLRLSDHLQYNPFDMTGCKNEINAFLLYLNAMKLQFDSIWRCLITEGYETEEEAEKWYIDKTELRLLFNGKYNKVIDHLIDVINVRFSELNKITFVALLDVKMMLQKPYSLDKYIHCLDSVYPDLFNMTKLKSELEYLYSCENCHDLKSVVDVFNALFDIKDILIEVWKLVKLVYALPIMYPITKDRPSFEFEGKNTSLAIISSERSLLENLKKSQVLYNRAIEEFYKSEQRIKLLYR